MAEKTGIAWCDSTFNPWLGCRKVSPACDNCYAETWGKRFGVEWGVGKPRCRTSASTWRQPLRWNRKSEIKFRAWEKFKKQYPRLTDAQLLERGFIKPRRPRVFCGSLCDVFDNEVDPGWRYDLFNIILSTPYLDWLLLTKRIGNTAKMIDELLPEPDSMKSLPPDHPLAWPWPNVWLGITVCNQEEADRDIPKLLAVPAAKRFVSIEPMLGQVDLTSIQTMMFKGCEQINALTGRGMDFLSEPTATVNKLDWIICGGETGTNARAMHPDWVRGLRDQCMAAGVPFFFKQNGEWLAAPEIIDASGSLFHRFDNGTWVQRVGAKAAGRLLDEREWNEVPV
jgi:protein gp37